MKQTAFAALILLALAAAASAAAQKDAAAEVRRADEQVVQAVLKGDAAALDRMYAPDYRYIGPDGATRTRAQSLADTRSGSAKFERIDVADREVAVYGDAAVVTGRELMKGRTAAGAFDANVRFLAVYVKRDGRWQEAAFQSTPIQKR